MTELLRMKMLTAISFMSCWGPQSGNETVTDHVLKENDLVLDVGRCQSAVDRQHLLCSRGIICTTVYMCHACFEPVTAHLVGSVSHD